MTTPFYYGKSRGVGGRTPCYAWRGEAIVMINNLPRPVRNREIMLRALEGQTPEDIAQVYELEPSTIKNILESPLVKDQMLRLQTERGKEIVQKVKERSHEALETMTDIMRGEVNSELRFKATKDMLDRNPDLRPKSEGAKEFGEGLGEAIIRELSKRRNGEAPINERYQSGGSGETSPTALLPSK